MRELLYKTMPVVDFVIAVIYNKDKANKMYRRLFLKILTHATRYDPMSYMEAAEYWEDVVLKIPEDEMRSQAIIYLWRVLDGFISYHPVMTHTRRNPPEDYLIGGVIFRLRNFIRDRETYRRRVQKIAEALSDVDLQLEYCLDDDYFTWDWVVHSFYNFENDYSELKPFERQVVKYLAEGYKSTEIRKRLSLDMKTYSNIISNIRKVLNARQ